VTRRLALATALACGLSAASTATGDPMMTEDFSDSASSRWSFFTDQVMGGVSTGQAALETEGEETFLRLQGRVSTENNGGFIQARWEPSEPVADSARGVEIEVRGNDQTYYLHLRTRGTRLPWQFYQAPFEVTGGWTVLRIPFADFAPKGRLLSKTFAPDTIRSLAVAAYGRDHAADVSVRRIGFY
jgi:hypothetical protein